jgi:sulfur transfer protein SufE
MQSAISEFKDYIDQFDDDFDRTHAIMDLGKRQQAVGSQPESALKVHWHFDTVSDGLFTAGLAQLVVAAANGHTSEELEKFSADWFKNINLEGLITTSRINGFYNLIKVINGIVSQR